MPLVLYFSQRYKNNVPVCNIIAYRHLNVKKSLIFSFLDGKFCHRTISIQFSGVEIL